VRENSFDLLQADHTLSGIDTALWDLLGKKLEEPVYRLLGDNQSFPKTPYASQLFGDTPEETYARARKAADAGYRAAKFGWGPYGKCTLEQDIEQVRAARRGLGPDGTLLVDAGTAWGDDVAQAGKRIASLRECRVLWLEEPFVNGALGAYRALSDIAVAAPTVRLAGGEGCSNYHSAQQLIDFAGIGFIQIDTGRIGGITTARDVAQYAYERGVTFVNHTFTTQLALSASIQPYAGYEDAVLCEYPFEPSPLAVELTAGRTLLDAQGLVCLPEAPGLGLEPAPAAIRKYLVDVEIRVGAKVLYRTPEVVS